MESEGKTLSVPEAGRRYFNLGKNASYEQSSAVKSRSSRSGHGSGCQSWRSTRCSKRRGAGDGPRKTSVSGKAAAGHPKALL